MNDLIAPGILNDLIERMSQRLTKFVTQTQTLALIPGEGVFDISGRRRPDEYGFYTRGECKRSSTSLAGIPPGPSGRTGLHGESKIPTLQPLRPSITPEVPCSRAPGYLVA